MTDYREAVPGDLADLIRMAADGTARAYPGLPFDEAVAHETISEAIAGDDALVLIAYEDSTPVGFVIGQIVLSWFGDGRVAKDWITYADQAAHPWVFYNLHKQFVAWAKSRGADNIITSNFSGLSDTAMRRVLQRLGYTPVGTTARQSITDQ